MEFRGVKLKKITKRSKQSELFILKPSEHYSVPLLADDGDESKRVVNVGDVVSEGTLLAKPTGRYGSYVYSPCSGSVIGVVRKLNASGNDCEHVIIKRDLNEKKEYLPVLSLVDQNQENLLKRLYESGMIDNFFPFDPTYKKYLLKNSIKKLIINCSEADPYQSCESVLLENYMSEIVSGAKLFSEIARADSIVFIFTTKQKYLVKSFKKYIKSINQKNNIKVKVYPHIYPLHNARLIGYYETGKMVEEGNRTAETNVIVESPNNCYDFFDAVNKGIPAIQRALTIAGNNTLRKSNYFVKNGTPIRHILNVIGTKKDDFENMVIYGGVMSGVAQETLDVSVTLTASCLLFCDRSEYSRDIETQCINCGRCISVCPVRLNVKNLDEAILERDFYKIKKLGVKACINCGACSYVCPAKRYLSQRISFAKDYVLGKKAKKANSSEYVLVEGQDIPQDYQEFDKILNDTEKFETVNEKTKDDINQTDINDMLKILSKAKEKNGGIGDGK